MKTQNAKIHAYNYFVMHFIIPSFFLTPQRREFQFI